MNMHNTSLWRRRAAGTEDSRIWCGAGTAASSFLLSL
jgi:hypothetical protein